MTLGRTRGVFQHDVLPPYLSRTRWFPERSPAAITTTVTSAIPFANEGDNRPWLAFFEWAQNDAAIRYTIPLRIRWHRFERERHNPRALAAVRQGAREGTLLDVASERDFIEILINNLRSTETVEEGSTRLEFRPTDELLKRPTMEIAHVHAVETEQSNSTALVDNAYVVKIYRKLESGINPELEVGRFLTEVAGFANSPALLGGIELVEGERRSAIGIVHGFVDDRRLVEQKLSNYWGYNSLSFFAPEARYGPDNPLDAFRTTVARLHDAGIEVLLDVVYNHTAEGNHLGPTLSFRGIDNTSYYWLQPDNARYYDDFTGTGNSLNLTHPRVTQMVMDSLRYWVEVCHVDGFRFDLATTLARGAGGFDRNSGFLTAVRQDPALAATKLVAEPWLQASPWCATRPALPCLLCGLQPAMSATFRWFFPRPRVLRSNPKRRRRCCAPASPA